MSAELKTISDFYRPGQQVQQLITLEELAKLWSVPVTWLRTNCQRRCADPLPRVQLGRYVRVNPSDPALAQWLARRTQGARDNRRV
jgi:hypothetical protein